MKVHPEDREQFLALRRPIAGALTGFCLYCFPMIVRIAISHKHGLYQPACVGSYLGFVAVTVWLWRGVILDHQKRRKAH